MSNKREFSVEQGVANYEYPIDGLIRRQLHEFGATGFDFYGEVFKGMGYSSEDVVLDIGAGIGTDGLQIAAIHHPRVVYLLEPEGDEPAEFDNKYFHLDSAIQQRGLDYIRLLPSSALNATAQEIAAAQSSTSQVGITYIQPTGGMAEAIPLPDSSVTKLSMIHSAYHFFDLNLAMEEASRVLRQDGIGVLVTNGPGDKMRFKEFLQKTGQELQNGAPNTVSSRLDYHAALTKLSDYFDIIGEPLIYRDEMVITPDRLPAYIWAYDSYRHLFDRVIINDGKWTSARQKVLEAPIAEEMASNNGIFSDTIDIGAIYFRPK
jgi:SAM-dependent methyltransferase